MNRPKVVVIIGGNEEGKTTWGRSHRRCLPLEFYNADVTAEGLCDANSTELQVRARALVDWQITERLWALDSFGFESTGTGRWRPAIVRNAPEDKDPRHRATFEPGYYLGSPQDTEPHKPESLGLTEIICPSLSPP